MTKHVTTVAVEYGKLEHIMDWCRHNCSGKLNVDYIGDKDGDLINTLNYYQFAFTDEQDYIIFNLKFK